MKYRQKALLHGLDICFTFEHDELRYSYKVGSDSLSFNIKYLFLPNIKEHVRSLMESNQLLLVVGVVLTILGIFVIVIENVYREPIYIDYLTPVIGLVCLFGAPFIKGKYSLIETENGVIAIFHNKQHDQILEELMARRKEALLHEYGDISVNGTKEDEKQKVEWLHKQGVLTKEEMEKKVAELECLFMQDESETFDNH